MISLRAISATPRPAVSAINGLLRAPPPEFSWRTRRDTKFTRTFGLPTLAKAFLHSSMFIRLQFKLIEPHTLRGGLRKATGKSREFYAFILRFRDSQTEQRRPGG